MAYTFDHGLTEPVRTTLARSVAAMLADITWNDGDPETPYGPVLREIRRIPLSFEALRTTAEGIKFWQDWIPKQAPSVALEIGRRTFTIQNPPLISHSEIDVSVYVISGQARAEILGRYEPDSSDNRHDPGLDAIEDLVESRLLGQSPGLPFGALRPVLSEDLVVTGQMSVRELRYRTEYRYQVCPDRDAPDVAEIQVDHHVQGAGKIAEQRSVLSL